MAQSVKHLTLDFGPGHDLSGMEWKSMSGSVLCGASASLPLPPSLSNKQIKKKKNRCQGDMASVVLNLLYLRILCHQVQVSVGDFGCRNLELKRRDLSSKQICELPIISKATKM